ncbi:MAG: VWA domain-containing protein [Bdellovibrionaceae bacterium]|nr:VWA domain-containing protein [Pseudobdellovibrionaceae bacterium]
MFRFENHDAFQWLWLLPILWVIVIATARLAARRLQSAFGAKLSPLLTSSVSKRKRLTKNILMTLVLVLMVFALARPQAGQSSAEVKSAGVELMLLVDVSESMMAEDLKPNRLTQAKIELSRMVERLPGHKIGVIAFAGSAALLSPLTTDPNALKMYLDSLSPQSVSAQGTNFSRAIEEAVAAFKRGGEQDDPTTRVTRVILVASDGEDHEQGALEAAKKLTAEGVRIFALAYGTETGGVIPQRDSLGFLRGYKKTPGSNQDIVSQVKGDALRALAQAGQGSFYHSSFGGSHINEVVEDINRLEKTEFDSRVVTQYDEKFTILLWAALVLALIELLLGERHAVGRLWKGRFEVSAS